MLQIAADTGFFGAPVEAFLDDRRLMQDIFVAYYVDCEPEHLWVAELDGTLVGYICGSVGGPQVRRQQAQMVRAALFRLVTLRYRIGARSWRYFIRTARAALSGDYPRVDLSGYPAHLHINLMERARGSGLGKRLMQACLEQMVTLGVPGIHLNTTSMNVAAIKLYEKMGFQLLARRRTRLWEPWFPSSEVANLVYGRSLGSPRL